MLRIRSFNRTIAATNTPQQVFVAPFPKVTFLSFALSTGTAAYIGQAGVNAGATPPVGSKVGTTEREFYAQAREIISTNDLWVSGTLNDVLTVTYIEVIP